MATKLQCEICGGKLIGKAGGIYECDSCGMEYDTTWVKEKIQEIKGTVKVEGTVEVTGKVQVEGGTVQVDTKANKDNLLKRGFQFLGDFNWQSANEYFDKVLDIDSENGEAYLGKLLAEAKVINRNNLGNTRWYLEQFKNYSKVCQFGSPELVNWLTETAKTVRVKIEEQNKESTYLRGLSAMKLQTKDGYHEAQKLFASIIDYKDAKEQLITCAAGIETLDKGAVYQQGLSAKRERTEAGYRNAAKLFASIPDYRDAQEQQLACEEQAERCGILAETAVRWIEAIAVALKAGNDSKKEPTPEENLAEAKTRIDYLSVLRDSFGTVQDRMASLQKELEEAETQESRLLAQRAKLGIFAGKEKKRLDGELSVFAGKKREIAGQLAACEKKLNGFASEYDIVRAISETTAIATGLEAQIEERRAAGDVQCGFEKALKLYLNNQNVTRLVNTIYPGAVFAEFVNGKTDTLRFGKYPFRKDGYFRPIEWQILAREQGRMLVISKYALDCRQYHSESTDITWEKCSLRKWLNETFLNTAFSTNEQKVILNSTVRADKNPTYLTSPGNNTVDKVFLLSSKEATAFFNSNEARKCKGTEYCYAQGATKAVDGCCQWWWVRTSGSKPSRASRISYYGIINDGGDDVNLNDTAVRPALWIDLSAGN